MSTAIIVTFIDDVGGSNTEVKAIVYDTLDLRDGQQAFNLCVKALDEWSGIPVD